MNRKIKNATPYVLDGIQFKSKLEMRIYKLLKDEGLSPEYEKYTFVLSNKVRPTIGFFERTQKRKFHYEMKPLQEITYTPDFIFKCNGINIILEAKGIANDVYPVKKNLFRKRLEHLNEYALFFEIKTIGDLKECLKIIKMETPLTMQIRKGIPNLPEKDISLANKYMEQRDFDSLLELVSSAIKRVNKNKEKYPDIEVAYLHKLKELIYEYNEARSI